MNAAHRLIVLLLGVLVAWLGPLTSVQAVLGTAGQVPFYVNNGQQHTAMWVESAAERGPPIGLFRTDTYTYDTVDRWSHGASSHPAVSFGSIRTAYTTSAALAQGASLTTTTPEQARRLDEKRLSLCRDGGAADSAAVGASRVDRVLAEFGEDVVDTGRIVKTPYGSTDIDVVLRDNTFIEVGGPAKSINLSKFGQQLQRVRWAADQAGGRALFRYAPGTPQEAIDLALKWFGPGGAGPIG